MDIKKINVAKEEIELFERYCPTCAYGYIDGISNTSVETILKALEFYLNHKTNSRKYRQTERK